MISTMNTEFWVSTGLKVIAIGAGATGLWKLGEKFLEVYFSRDKLKAEAEKIKVEAEIERTKANQQILNNVMEQLKDVRNENMSQAKEMSQLRIDHMRELDEERKSCFENMQILSDRIRELEANWKPKN